jgi:PPM family protein phosphatase
MSLSLRYAARSHVGLIRDDNEDSGYAGPRLLMVADGMGGQAAGELASSVAVQTLAQLDSPPSPESPGDPIQLLSGCIFEAHSRLRAMVAENPQLEGMGTTLTALLFANGQLSVAHIGDSRAYRLRSGRLEQLTTDHTWVQRLVDEGRISAEEAGHHPQRSLLMRALDGRGPAEPDLSTIDVQVGDRFMLCSDGLCGVVSFETIESAVAGHADIHSVAESLIQLALRGGRPDNITCIVADVVQEYPPGYLPDQNAQTLEYSDAQSATTQYLEMPMAVGAAAEQGTGGLPVFGGGAPATATVPTARAMPVVPSSTPDDSVPHDTPASRAARLRRKPAAEPGAQRSGGMPSEAGDEAEEPDGTEWTKPSRRRRMIIAGVVVLALLVVVVGGGYYWSQQQFYVADADGVVAVYQGVDFSVAGVKLSHVVSTDPKILVSDLPTAKQGQVKGSITADSLSDAESILAMLQTAAQLCTSPPLVLPTPAPTPTVNALPTHPVTSDIPPNAAPTGTATPTPSDSPAATGPGQTSGANPGCPGSGG